MRDHLPLQLNPFSFCLLWWNFDGRHTKICPMHSRPNSSNMEYL
jgi:hypothetical protein